MTPEAGEDIESKIKSKIREIPNFPKPGVLFKDITPILKDPHLCREIVDEFVRRVKGKRVDAVVGIESRGFLFGFMFAEALQVPFIPVRKEGKLPGETVSYSYFLEYGSATVEIHRDAFPAGTHVVIHDDLIATGGTAAAAGELVHLLGGTVSAFLFIISLDYLGGKTKLTKYSDTVVALARYT